MLEAVVATLLGLYGLSWVAYYSYHTGQHVPGIHGIGKVVARVIYPGEEDLQQALAYLASADTGPGGTRTPMTPCDPCNGSTRATGANAHPPVDDSLTWRGTQGELCYDVTPGGVAALNYVGDVLGPGVKMTAEKYMGAGTTPSCVATRPPDMGHATSLVSNCSAITGINGVPTNSHAFWDPKEYIAQRVFGMSVAALRKASVQDALVGNKTVFIEGSPYQCIRPGTQYTARDGSMDSPPVAQATLSLTAYYENTKTNQNLQSSYSVFIPPQLFTVSYQDIANTGWPDPNNPQRTGNDLYLPNQWLVLSTPYQGLLWRALRVKDLTVSIYPSLSQWASCSQGFRACYIGTTPAGHRLNVCEWSPTLLGGGNKHESTDTGTIRGLLDWTADECRTYIDLYLQFTSTFLVQSLASPSMTHDEKAACLQPM